MVRYRSQISGHLFTLQHEMGRKYYCFICRSRFIKLGYSRIYSIDYSDCSPLVVYVALMPKTIERNPFPPDIDSNDYVILLSVRVTAVLLSLLRIETIAFGFQRSTIIPTLLLD
jgi:hypothetical protein